MKTTRRKTSRIIIRFFSVFTFCSISSVFLFAQNDSGKAIRITEPKSGTILSYPVALLRGELDDRDATEVRLVNPLIHQDGRSVLGQAYQGRFRVLAPLKQGKNSVAVRCGQSEKTIELHYIPNENPYRLHVVYMTDSSGNIEFQTPDEDDATNYRRKLSTAMKLMQTMTAERMYDLGYGRRTFNLPYDADGEVVVHLMKGRKTAEEYQNMKTGWFGQVAHELQENFPTKKGRYLVIPAYSRFDPIQKKSLAYTALGGGALALFGGSTLYCWPNDIETAVKSMTDTTRIDRARYSDDSVGRNCYWACASTCIGASLHELGHTMGLPHTNDPTDIMTRGHDHFFRVFLVREAPSAWTGFNQWTDFREDQAARFAPASAAVLLLGPWFAEEDPSDRTQGEIEIIDDKPARCVTVEAENGVGCVTIMENGEARDVLAPTPDEISKRLFPLTMKIPYDTIRKVVKGKKAGLRVIDGNGFPKGGFQLDFE